ncbi:MAG: hypothetical protein K6E78_09245 [Treponema sp.]|nr:hypothetical protein [Treponema sp.]
MVKLEFPRDLVKGESNIFFNALFRAIKEKAPQLFEVLEKEGLCTLLYYVSAVVYPKDCTSIDMCWFSFSFWGRKDCIVWLPGKLKNTEKKSYVSNFKDAIIYTPKGSETDVFFKASSFPKEVRNGYPKIKGKTIVPDDKLYIWLDDGKEEDEAEPNESKRQPDSKRTLEKAEKQIKFLHGERKKSLQTTNLWSLIPALMGLVITILILVIILKRG